MVNKCETQQLESTTLQNYKKYHATLKRNEKGTEYRMDYSSSLVLFRLPSSIAPVLPPLKNKGLIAGRFPRFR